MEGDGRFDPALGWHEIPIPSSMRLLRTQTAKLVFTGSGAEYFRIWVVNLLLTLVTLGVYSAWAKVRKARYFRSNTWLDGHVFDYHGDPKAILRGRVVALVLAAAYSWGFAFSKVAGVATLATLSVVGPWLFMRGQQFALANTSFRGLRFGFHARPVHAYRTLLPILSLWWMPALVGLNGNLTPSGLASLALMTAWPFMHHRLKAYQHGNATYGDRSFAFTPALGRFYVVYARGTGLILAAFVSLAVAAAVFASCNRGRSLPADSSRIVFWIYGSAVVLVLYLSVWPYYSARLQKVVWDQTRLGDIGFRTEIRVWPLSVLALQNTILVLLTGGLYWPWAAIAMARYRLECVQVESERPLSMLAGNLQAGPISATGDGSLDAFGIDIGL